MGLPARQHLLDDGLRLLEKIPVPASESGQRLGSRTAALDAHARRIHALSSQHGQHALPWRGCFGEADDGLAHEIGPAEARHGLPAEQKEAAPAAHLGEVRQESALAVRHVEASHEPAQGDLDAPVEQGLDSTLPEPGRGLPLDVKPFLAEVSQGGAGGQRGVEGRVERHQHGHRTQAHERPRLAAGV